MATVEERLQDLRRRWEAERNPRYLSAALFHLRGEHPELDWLFKGLRDHLKETLVSPKRRQQNVLAEQGLDIVLAVCEAMGDNVEKPSEATYREAVDKLNAAGLHCTIEGVKKTWRRHRPKYD